MDRTAVSIVMPELQGVRLAFAESASVTLRWDGMAIYFVALVGWVTRIASLRRRVPLRFVSRHSPAGS